MLSPSLTAVQFKQTRLVSLINADHHILKHPLKHMVSGLGADFHIQESFVA